MINKHQFDISNTKKVLHKVGKQWVTVSVALLALIGVSAAASSINHSAIEPTHIVASAATVNNKAEYEDGTTPMGIKWISGTKGTSAKTAIDYNMPNGYAAKYHSDNQSFKNNGDALPVNVIRARVMNRVEYEDGASSPSVAGVAYIHGIQGRSAKSAIDAHVPNGYAVKYHTDRKTFKPNDYALYVNVIRARNTNKIEYEDGTSFVSSYNATGLKGTSAKSIIDAHVPNGYAVKYHSDNKNFKNNGDRLYINVIRARNMNKIEYENGTNLISSFDANGIAGASAKSTIDSHIPSGYIVNDGSDAKDFLNGNGDALEVNVSRKQAVPESNHVANNIEYENGDQIAGHLMVNGIKGHSAKSAIDTYLPEGYRIVGASDNKVFKNNLDALEVNVARVRLHRTRFYYGLVRFGKHARKHLTIRLTSGLIEYNSLNFSNDAEVRGLHKGLVLPIKAIYRARNGAVRFQLTNGHFITAMKRFSTFTNRRALRKNRRVRRTHRTYVSQAVRNMFKGHRYVRVHMRHQTISVRAKNMRRIKVLRTKRHGRHITYFVKMGRKYGRIYGRYYL